MYKIFRTHRLIALVVFSLFASQYALAQNTAPTQQSSPQTLQQQSPQQIAVKVEQYMQAAVSVSHFSGSVLVAHNGQAIVSKGYGMANIELDVRNAPQTKFRLGSLTKQFTAMAILMLQERGKLNLSDSICKYLTDCPAAWQPITLRNLLTHTSGVPNYTDFPDFTQTATLSVSPVSLTERFRNKPLEFVPGEKFKYSNSGYILLGLVIERASGKPYVDFLRENIFTPLGMTNTDYDNNRAIVKNRAAGYALQGGSLVNASYIDMSVPFAAGGLYTTVEDMLRWDQALYTEKLVSRKSIDEMFTPFKENYGYGWIIANLFNRQVILHGGSVFGFSTSIARFPADHITVIILSNNENSPSGKISRDLAAINFGESYEIPQEREAPRERKAIALAPQILERYVGEYQLAPNFVLAITYENGKLMAQATGQPKIELLAESETEFFLTAVDAQITFVKDSGGSVTGLVLHQNKRDIPAQKIK